jgi:hypothetical protein
VSAGGIRAVAQDEKSRARAKVWDIDAARFAAPREEDLEAENSN